MTETVGRSWTTETLKTILKVVEQETKKSKGFLYVLHAPYVKGFLEGLQRKMRKFDIRFVPKKGQTLYSKLCKLKHRNDPEKKKMLCTLLNAKPVESTM